MIERSKRDWTVGGSSNQCICKGSSRLLYGKRSIKQQIGVNSISSQLYITHKVLTIDREMSRLN